MQKIYLTGEIKSDYRELNGTRAVILTHTRALPDDIRHYTTNVGSDDFLELTGDRSLDQPVDRVYIGVTREGADLISRLTRQIGIGRFGLDNIDKTVVSARFLK